MKKIFLLACLWPSMVFAQQQTQLTGNPMDLLRSVGGGTDLPDDPAVIITLIVDLVLGLTATVLFILIFISGYRWMTSGGNAEQIKTAKNTILNAIVGLAIILMSYALSTFIMKNIVGSSGTGGGG